MRVFISHSHRDKPIVHKIAERLRHEGLTPLLDEEIIRPGQSWTEGIHRAVANSDALIVLISRATAESKWQTSEIALAIAQQQNDPSKRVIPVLIEKDAELPFFLRDRLYCDLSDEESFHRNFPQLLQALQAPFEAEAEPMEVDRARLKELRMQQDILMSEAKDFERRRVAWTSTVLGALASVIAASAALLTFSVSRTKLDLGFLKDTGPFAMGIVFGVLSSLLATLAYRLIQKRAVRKEDGHGK